MVTLVSLLSLLVLLVILSSSFLPCIFLVSKGVLGGSLAFFLQFMVDHSGVAFLSSVSVISLAVYSWSVFYMKGATNSVFFFIILFGFVSSMLLLIVSGSYLTVFLGWEGLGVTSFLLIVFYQNWMSTKGGLLTLLTNRVGDAILLVTFSYWLFGLSFFKLGKWGSLILALLLFIVAMTKSAQVPFTSWLPAAMAAPTPVSALVHSSTLVTAGVWLVFRFISSFYSSVATWGLMGLMTLMMASAMALSEIDGKKVVALSTLSQLGLMFTAISVGGFSIGFFHLLSHAFAKANLFLVVGSLIYARFSQQDTRMISSGWESYVLVLSLFISLVSLSGVAFSSGFFSKESILLFSFSSFNSLVGVLIMMSVVSLTLAYCLKLFLFLGKVSQESDLNPREMSVHQGGPIFVLTLIALLMGSAYQVASSGLMSFWLASFSGVYWLFLFLGAILLSLSLPIIWSALFVQQSQLIDLMNAKVMLVSKIMSLKATSSYLEGLILSNSLSLLNILSSSLTSRFFIILTLSILISMTF